PGRASPLPGTVRAGAALDLGGAAGLRTILALDAVRVEGTTSIATGLEAGYRAAAGFAVLARAGFDGRARSHDAASPLTLGAGLVLGRFRLDYAYRGVGPLGATHHFGFSLLQAGATAQDPCPQRRRASRCRGACSVRYGYVRAVRIRERPGAGQARRARARTRTRPSGAERLQQRLARRLGLPPADARNLEKLLLRPWLPPRQLLELRPRHQEPAVQMQCDRGAVACGAQPLDQRVELRVGRQPPRPARPDRQLRLRQRSRPVQGIEHVLARALRQRPRNAAQLRQRCRARRHLARDLD